MSFLLPLSSFYLKSQAIFIPLKNALSKLVASFVVASYTPTFFYPYSDVCTHCACEQGSLFLWSSVIFVKSIQRKQVVSREQESGLGEGKIAEISISPAWRGVEYPEKVPCTIGALMLSGRGVWCWFSRPSEAQARPCALEPGGDGQRKGYS